MKLNWRWWLASRYLVARRREKKNVLSILAIAGLSLGVATLITVMAVMNGFQGGTIRLLTDLQSMHVRIEGQLAKDIIADQELLSLLRTEPGTETLVPFGEFQALVRSAFANPSAVHVRGVPPEELSWILTKLAGVSLVRGSKTFLSDRGLLIGEYLAQELGVRPGDTIWLVRIGPEGSGVTEEAFEVDGIISYGNQTFDQNWILAPLTGTLGASFSEENVLGIRLKNSGADLEYLARLRHRLGSNAEIQSWRTFNSSIFGALRVEKLIMALTVGLMFLVVAVNLYHDMRVSVREKQEDMGVLLSLGARPRDTVRIFVLQGTLLGLIGGTSGLLLGLLLVSNLEQLYNFFSAGLGFLSDLPVELSLTESLFIASGAVAAGFGASWTATHTLRRRQVADILRNG